MSDSPVSLTPPPEGYTEAWPNREIVQQLVGRLPWGHNLVLLTRLKDTR